MSPPRPLAPHRRAALGLVAASLASALPVGLAGAKLASAGSVLTARARMTLDALRPPDLGAVKAGDPSAEQAGLAVDGRLDTAWTGRAGEPRWTWSASFAKPVHLGLIRAKLGQSTVEGVPTAYRWEARAPGAGGACATSGDEGWAPLPGASASPDAAGMRAQPTRRSWFVDADACALRLVVDATNAAPPTLREVEAIESARDVLRGGVASDDGAWPGFRAAGAIDGTYGGRWAGAPGKGRWTLRVDLRAPTRVDRVRVVLGFDATTVPRRESGRAYAIAWAPVHTLLEGSEDGRHFFPLATDPVRADGSPLPLRRRLVTLPEPKTLRAVRLVMTGATGESGQPEPDAAPVVRELSAFAADDPRPVIAAPWILSVNANPSAESHRTPGGELTNDAYWAKFLQRRFAFFLPAMRADDRYDRSLGPRGEPLDAPPHDEAGEVLEAIEGDDAQLDAELLSRSSPPPIAILSGSDDWDYDARTEPDRKSPYRWHWDPLRPAFAGGMGQLAAAVRQRVSPFLGFCGGAQILALLEARQAAPGTDDQALLDRIVRRTSGSPIRGFAPPIDVVRAWPGEPRPRATIEFRPGDTLFTDLAGPWQRASTQAFLESHADAVRADAFAPGAPLDRFDVLATSAFCAPDVTASMPGAFPNPRGPGFCEKVTEAFRSRDAGWPVVGAQFHAEQRDFNVAAPGDPAESVADGRLFFVAAYEEMIDAYVKMAQ